MHKVLCVTSKDGWCWQTTAKALADASGGWIECSDVGGMNPARARAQFIKRNYELVYLRGYAFLAPRVARHCKRLVWTFSTGGTRTEQRLRENRNYMKCAGIVCQNFAAEMAVRAAGATGAVTTIPNGVDCARFQASAPPPAPIIGMAANVSTRRENLKGAGFLPEIGWLLNYPVKVVGKSVAGRLTHEQMPDWYKGIKYYVQPSTAEGCSNSVMEAMASGRVCLICEGIGYHGEVCRGDWRDPAAQVVFVPRDPAEIAAAIFEVESRPEVYQRIAANARRFAEAHTWARIAALYVEYFQSLI